MSIPKQGNPKDLFTFPMLTTYPTRPACLVTCFENSYLVYDKCRCECLPGYYFDYFAYKCLKPQTTKIRNNKLKYKF